MHTSAHSIKAKRRLPSILRYARRRLCGATRLFARWKATLPCTFVWREEPITSWVEIMSFVGVHLFHFLKKQHSYLFCCGCTLIRRRRGTVSAGLQFWSKSWEGAVWLVERRRREKKNLKREGQRRLISLSVFSHARLFPACCLGTRWDGMRSK